MYSRGDEGRKHVRVTHQADCSFCKNRFQPRSCLQYFSWVKLENEEILAWLRRQALIESIYAPVVSAPGMIRTTSRVPTLSSPLCLSIIWGENLSWAVSQDCLGKSLWLTWQKEQNMCLQRGKISSTVHRQTPATCSEEVSCSEECVRHWMCVWDQTLYNWRALNNLFSPISVPCLPILLLRNSF